MNPRAAIAGPALPAGTLPAERIAAFAAAARHSRRVRRLRVALPLAGVLLAVAVAGLGVVSRIRAGLAFGDIHITSEGLAMDAPRLSGSDGKGRTYEVTAGRAVQDLADPQVIRLYDISAHVRQADGRWADLGAASGVYDAGKQTLVLTRDITIRGSDGSAADLSRAEIDLSTGAVNSDAPVAFSSSLGAVRADGMEVGEKGGAVTFQGGVKMTIDPGKLKEGGSLPGDLGLGDDKGDGGQ